MEAIRGGQGDFGQEICGEAERRGARTTGGDDLRGQASGTVADEGVHPVEGGRVGGGRWLEGDSAISAALDTSINNIGRTRRRLVEEGMAAALTRKYNPNSARPRIFDGAAEAKLIALACSPAPEGFARWSLRLLEEKVVELNIVEKASNNTIGRTLKKRPQAPPQSAMGDPAGRQWNSIPSAPAGSINSCRNEA